MNNRVRSPKFTIRLQIRFFGNSSGWDRFVSVSQHVARAQRNRAVLVLSETVLVLVIESSQ